MSKSIFILTILMTTMFRLDIVAQKKCSCSSDTLLQTFVNCDTKYFKNGASLYWQYNCDSSWLTFENKRIKRVMYSLNAPMISLTDRIGYIFMEEYKSSLLFINKPVSGGWRPSNFELISKNDGTVMKEFGTIIYFSNDTVNNFVLYFSNATLDTLTLYSIDKDAEFHYSLPKGRISKTVSESSEMYAEFLFGKPTIDKNILTFTYQYLVSSEPEKWSSDKIQIDLLPIKLGRNK